MFSEALWLCQAGHKNLESHRSEPLAKSVERVYSMCTSVNLYISLRISYLLNPQKKGIPDSHGIKWALTITDLPTTHKCELRVWTSEPNPTLFCIFLFLRQKTVPIFCNGLKKHHGAPLWPRLLTQLFVGARCFQFLIHINQLLIEAMHHFHLRNWRCHGWYMQWNIS